MSARFPDHVLTRMGRRGSATHLGLLRILFGLYVLFLYSSPLWTVLPEMELSSWRGLTWSLFPGPLEDALSGGLVHEIWVVGVVATALMAVGLATRASTLLAGLCYLVLYGYYYRLTKSHTEWIYWNFVFTVFVLAPVGDRLSLDAWIRRRRGGAREPARPSQSYRWPVEVVILWVAVSYVAAGLAKTFPLQAGAAWLGGDMLQTVATDLYFDSPVHWVLGRPLFDYSVGGYFVVGSLLAIATEFSAVFMLLQRRWNPLLMVGLILMHMGIYLLTGVIAFVYSAVLLLAFFIPPEWFADFGEGGSDPPSDVLPDAVPVRRAR